MSEKQEESLESTLIQVLKEKNLQQIELDKLREQSSSLEEEVEVYKDMMEDYKAAADDRLNRLQLYEDNILLKKLCSLFLHLKKKEIDKKKQLEYKYWNLYSGDEKIRYIASKESLEELKYRPLISLVIPVYNTDLQLLEELVLSLRIQSYTNWEACFANGSKENLPLSEQLQQYAKEDSRIKVSDLEKNGGISYNTNQAFAMSTGEFIGMVDHDDLLAPDALAQIVIALNKDPEIDFLYSDQDKVDEKTNYRFGAFYKPQWSNELLYSGNYITHFSVVRRSMIEEIGLWDSSTDGAQDWDLFLKIMEKTDKICAIPMVLYHWRTAPTSTASSMDTKNYAAAAQIKSLQDHFDRMNYPAKIHFFSEKDLQIHVEWQNEVTEDVSVIIWDQGINGNLNDFIWFISLVLKDRLKEIIVVSASDERLEQIHHECIKIQKACSGYAEAYNCGAKSAQGEKLIFSLDSALSKSQHTYHELADWLNLSEIDLVAPKIVDVQKRIMSLGIALNKESMIPILQKKRDEIGRLTTFGTTGWYRNVSAVDWSLFAVSKNKFFEVNGFEEGLGELAMIDFCLKIRKTSRILVNPFAKIQYTHHSYEKFFEQRRADYQELLEKYHMEDVDPYYNVNLLKKLK